MKDGSVQVYDLNGIGPRTVTVRPAAILRSPTTAMRAASISRDATYVVGLGQDRSVWSWFHNVHSLITRTPRVPLAATSVLAHDAGWTKGILASVMRDGKQALALHDLTTGMQLRELSLPAGAVAKRASCDASCNRIAVASEQGLLLWSISGSRASITIPDQTLLELSSDGTRVLAHSGTESLTLLDGTTGAVVKRLPYHPFPTEDPHLIEEPHFISDDRFIDVLGETTLYDGRTGAVVEPLPSNRGRFSPIRASPDGRRAIITIREEEPLLRGQELLWDLEHGQPIVQEKFSFEAVSWTGHRLLVRDTIWRLLDTETGKQIREWQAPAGSFVLAPDGRRALQTTGRSPRIVDLETGTIITTLIGHDGDVKSAEFSPDGATVITMDDRFIRYWDIETGLTLAVFSRGFAVATSQGPGMVSLESELKFSPDGRRCVFTGNGVISYDLDPTRWLVSACANLRTQPSLWPRVEPACGNAVR